MNYLKPGDILNNGAIVIKHSQESRKVLAIVPGGNEPFVIWSIDEDGNTFNGLYYKSNHKAACEFGYLI